MLKFKKIKKDDTVKVISGKNINKTGKVIEVDREDGRVLVEGVNIVKKTMKKSKENQQGGITEVEAFLDVSKVMVICPKCKKETRVGFKDENGKKVRFCKKCNAAID